MRFIIPLLLVGLSSVNISAQKVEAGWKGLLPFKSKKADVEKQIRHYQLEYKTETAILWVDYSGDPCDPSAEYADRFNLPAATILRYEIQLRTPVPLIEFTFDENRFERTVMIYGPNKEQRAISYLQWELERWKTLNHAGVGYGIEIQVPGSGEDELATGFVYGPPYDRSQFECANQSKESL